MPADVSLANVNAALTFVRGRDRAAGGIIAESGPGRTRIAGRLQSDPIIKVIHQIAPQANTQRIAKPLLIIRTWICTRGYGGDIVHSAIFVTEPQVAEKLHAFD